MKEIKDTHIQMRTTKELKELAEQLAAENGKSLSAYIEELIKKAAKGEKTMKKYEIADHDNGVFYIYKNHNGSGLFTFEKRNMDDEETLVDDNYRLTAAEIRKLDGGKAMLNEIDW